MLATLSKLSKPYFGSWKMNEKQKEETRLFSGQSGNNLVFKQKCDVIRLKYTNFVI